MKDEHKKPFFYIATAIYMFFVAYMSLVRLDAPDAPHSTVKQVFYNSLHIPSYAVLTLLLTHCFKGISRKTLLVSALISVSYGILIEYWQSLTPYRSAEFGDVCLNTLGAGLVVFIYFKRNIKTT